MEDSLTYVFAIGWPSESDECAAVSPRRSRARAALRNACGCDGSGVSCARHFPAFYALFTCTQSKQPKRVLLVRYCTQSKTLVRTQNNTCTHSKQQDVPLCTSSAVGLLKSVEAGQSRQRRRAQHAKETPGNLEGCEADERPRPDRDLDPPLELYCW